MIIVKAMGGLGNQLQQYALYEKLCSLGRDVRLDVSWFGEGNTAQTGRRLELGLFPGVSYQEASGQERKAFLGNGSKVDKLLRKLYNNRIKIFRETDMYHPEVLTLTDGYLEGYWACESYYHDILPLLREKLAFPESTDPRNREAAERMRREPSVSLHLRRGDYLEGENAAMFGGICTEAYYEAAVRKLREAVPGAHFYVFSDDPVYAREHFAGEEFTQVDWNKGADSFYDMYLMSRCRHNICANSTFSFWGARLNDSPDKIMIRPLKHKNSQDPSFALMKGLWPGYRILDENGREG